MADIEVMLSILNQVIHDQKMKCYRDYLNSDEFTKDPVNYKDNILFREDFIFGEYEQDNVIDEIDAIDAIEDYIVEEKIMFGRPVHTGKKNKTIEKNMKIRAYEYKCKKYKH